MSNPTPLPKENYIRRAAIRVMKWYVIMLIGVFAYAAWRVHG